MVNIFFENLLSLFIKKLYFFIVRLIFSTNHKDIGTSYIILAVISCLAVTVLSLYIRATLAFPNSNFLSQTYHLYNLILTGHVFLMIFFSVMPGFNAQMLK